MQTQIKVDKHLKFPLTDSGDKNNGAAAFSITA